MIGGAGGLAGVRLCVVGLQFLEEGSGSSSPAPADVPRKVVFTSANRQEQTPLLHTMWNGTFYPTHGSIFDSDSDPDGSQQTMQPTVALNKTTQPPKRVF